MKKLLVACGTQRDLFRKCQGGIQLGPKILSILQTLVDENQVELSKVLDNLGYKTEVCLVPEALCCELRERFFVQCWSLVRTRWCQDQEDYSLVYLKDLLRLRKILTSTSTIGCEVKYPLESPRTSHSGGVFLSRVTTVRGQGKGSASSCQRQGVGFAKLLQLS